MLEFTQSARLGGPVARYAAAVALAILAQLAHSPLHPPSMVAFITYAPFVVAGATAGGLGPGLLCTILCTLESIFFALQPAGSFAIADPGNWNGVGALVVTGVVASVMAERLKRVGLQLAEAHRKTTAILDNIPDGFNAFDREWRYTYVNASAAKLTGKTREELLGKQLWELWPGVEDSAFGVAYRRAVAENIPVQVEAFYGVLNAWFDVRCYPSPEGLTLFFSDTTARKRTEEQMRLLESAVLQTSDGILIVKVSGEDSCRQQPVFANSAFERITGFNLEDLHGGAWALLFSPRFSPHGVEGPANAAGTTCPTYLEQTAERKDGTEIWLEWNFKPLAGPDGSHTHCVWTCRDVTERKRVEEASRLSNSIVAYSDDAIISKNLDGLVLTWNRGAERLYGYSAGEMVGQSIARLIPPDRPHELLEIVDALRRGARLEHYQTERLRKDGRRIAVSLTISPLHDSAGYVVGASTIGRDVTQLKLSEKALALSEERYRSLAYATTQIVWTTSMQGEVVEDIPMWRAFTGQSAEEVTGMGWIDALHPEDRERAAEVWLRAVASRSFYDTEYRMRRYDGEYRWMAVHGVPVLEGDRAIREWVATCADIHDRIQAEEQIRKLNEELERRVVQRTAELESANRELEAFAYSVSHDLRAPLRAVDGFSRILLEEYAPQLPEQAQHYLAVTRKNAVQMGELIDDLLAFSRLSRQPLRKQPIAPGDLVRQVLDELRADQEGRQVEITVGDLPLCEGDPGLLKQVLVNLLSNGFKYTRKREVARIEVGALTPDGGKRPVYYVRDNGVGFDMRYANKLFGVFQRLHGAQEYPGTGVGLAIVQRIVHRHGGQVWAEAGVNLGATFYFALAPSEPLSPAEELETCSINP